MQVQAWGSKISNAHSFNQEKFERYTIGSQF